MLSRRAAARAAILISSKLFENFFRCSWPTIPMPLNPIPVLSSRCAILLPCSRSWASRPTNSKDCLHRQRAVPHPLLIRLLSTNLSKGDGKPSLTFVGQVIINASQRGDKQAQESSPFIYCLSDPLELLVSYLRPCSPYNLRPLPSSSEVYRPPNHLVNKLGASCFHCGRAGHWHADCPHTKGVANPNLRPPSPTPFQPMRPATPD
ncbi:hypothetical protein O181_027550 [Austropuccinia psidii MF-1]|uniref:CCHC-type domain-containing protein n=1 Tax=Austropuccinia psidii MF-1 TaxID=1389203 RepID=A0A9Q3CRK6_9BASI|nr:hypothetical protein [Austropuccinia psidii MF-1]